MAQLFPLDTLSLKKWFIKNKRSFPWRKNCSPYAVWVSEIMLQQTKAAVVIPYFLKWMDHFPTIESLAKANLETVIKLWEGLGYYSRARNLHAGAKLVMEKFAGKLPPLEKELRQMKGLGPYTTSAILSFAFHQKKAAGRIHRRPRAGPSGIPRRPAECRLPPVRLRPKSPPSPP